MQPALGGALQLDPNIVGHAARSMREAVRHADAATNMDVPLLLGRGAGRDAVRAHAGDAAEWSRSAQSTLGPFDGALGDARTAAATLTDRMDAIRWDDGLIRLRRDVGTRQAVDAARDAAALLEQVEGGLRAPLGELGPQLAMADERAVAAVAASRMDELGGAGPFLAERTNGADDLLPRLGTPISRELLETHWERLLRASIQRDVRAASLRAAFNSVVDASPHPTRDPMPAWLRELPADTRIRLDAARANELQLLASSASREDVAALLLERLAVRTPDKDALRLMQAAGNLPSELRVELPLPDGAPSLAEMFVDDSYFVHPTHLLPLERAYVSLATSSDELLAREVDRLVSAPGKDDKDRLRRLALLGGERPDAVLGEAASQPWAAELLERALDPPTVEQAIALTATLGFVRRTGGDREALLQGLERLVHTPVADIGWTELAPGFALRMLPDAARPRGAQVIQSRLDAAFNAARSTVGEQFSAAAPMIHMVVDADRLAHAPSSTRASLTSMLDDLLARPFDEHDDASLRQLGLLTLQPPELLPTMGRVPGMLSLAPGAGPAHPWSVIDRLRILRDGERLASDGATPRTVATDLQRLLETPVEQLTVADIRRIVTLRSVPDEASPFVGERPTWGDDGLVGTARIGDLRASPTDAVQFSAGTRTEFERMRLDMERAALVHAGTTPEAVRAELRQLLETPVTELDSAQVRRLAILDGLPMPHRGVDPLPLHYGSLAEKWHPNLDAGRVGSDGRIIRGTARAFARSLETLDHVAAHPTTRAQLTDELALLLVRDVHRLDPAQHARIGQIATMPQSLRPELPAPRANYSLAEVYVEDMMKSDGGVRAMNAARVTVLRNSELGLNELVRPVRLDDGGVALTQLDPVSRDIVTGAGTEMLARLGISDRTMLRDVLEVTRASGSQFDVGRATREAAALLPGMTAVDPAEQALIDQVRGYVHRNLERIHGRLNDGYKRHPDYAEHGRAIEVAVLLERIEHARMTAGVTKAPAANVPDAAGVSW